MIRKRKGNKNHGHSGESARTDNGVQRKQQPRIDNRTPRPTQIMTVDQLKRLLQNDEESDILLNILMDDGPFMFFLRQNSIPSAKFCHILAVFARVCTDPTENQRTLLNRFFVKILPQTVTETHFLVRHLQLFIAQLYGKTAASSADRHLYTQAVHDLLVFARSLQATMPTASIDLLQSIMPLLQSQVDSLNRKSDCFKRVTVDLMNDVITGLSAQPLADNAGATAQAGHVSDVQPPDDFRTIAVCLRSEDVFIDEQPFVRPNVVHGGYAGGIDHYLDVQFRLMREDFVRPLRDGIQEYTDRYQSESRHKNNKSGDVRIYQNVRIVGSDFDNGELIFKAHFDVTALRNVQWKVFNRHISYLFVVCIDIH